MKEWIRCLSDVMEEEMSILRSSKVRKHHE